MTGTGEKLTANQNPIRAIFGGSFDPPHHAHVMVVLWALQSFENISVTIIPAFRHALGKEYGASFEHRLAMCEAAFRLLPADRIEISRIEEQRGGTSWMIDTIEALEKQYPDEDLRLLVGSDLVEEIPRWHRGDEIVERAKPLIVPRQMDGAIPKEGALPMISSTAIRELLAKREELNEARVTQLLPLQVFRIIQESDLYQ